MSEGMKCEYCGKEKLLEESEETRGGHPTITIKYKGKTKEVYVCPDCAAKNSIGDLLVMVTLRMKEKEIEKDE